MTTTATKSAKVAASLRKSTMLADSYSRGPIGSDVMALRIAKLMRPGPSQGKEGVRVWTGLADVEVTDVNTTHHQGVLAVDETAREVTQTYDVVRQSWDSSTVRSLARRWFPVNVPGRPKFRLDGSTHLRDISDAYGRNSRHFEVTASMVSPATSMTLLMGIDESSHFICALPERVETVQEAHDILRPAEVPEGSLRQGEWFFVPATDDEIDAVYRHIIDMKVKRTEFPPTWGGRGPRSVEYDMERGSTHRGMTVRVPEVGQFALGIIKDTRAGHHRELVLRTWHKVIRNTEVVFAEPRVRSERRTWD